MRIRSLTVTLTILAGLTLATGVGGCQRFKTDSDAVWGAGSVGVTQRMQEVLDEHAALGPKPIETPLPGRCSADFDILELDDVAADDGQGACAAGGALAGLQDEV